MQKDIPFPCPKIALAGARSTVSCPKQINYTRGFELHSELEEEW